MKKKTVSIVQHTWLNCSVSYFLQIDGWRMYSEYYSADVAKKELRLLAKLLDADIDPNTKYTNELFS